MEWPTFHDEVTVLALTSAPKMRGQVIPAHAFCAASVADSEFTEGNNKKKAICQFR